MTGARTRVCCDAKERARRAAQLIIAEIGSVGPENVESAAQRAVDEIRRLKWQLEGQPDA